MIEEIEKELSESTEPVKRKRGRPRLLDQLQTKNRYRNPKNQFVFDENKNRIDPTKNPLRIHSKNLHEVFKGAGINFALELAKLWPCLEDVEKIKFLGTCMPYLFAKFNSVDMSDDDKKEQKGKLVSIDTAELLKKVRA